MWVQQHSIKLVKYAQGYLSQPERLWTYMSPSNRCTDYGLQLAPEEWLKQPVNQTQTSPSSNSTITLKRSGDQQYCNTLRTIWVLHVLVVSVCRMFKQYACTVYFIVEHTTVMDKIQANIIDGWTLAKLHCG